MKNTIKQIIFNHLLEMDGVKQVEEDLLNMRCFRCGDSRKDRHKKRLYIRFNKDDDSAPIVFKCFNCPPDDSSGVWTTEMNRQVGLTDLNTNSKLRTFNNNSSHTKKKKKIMMENYTNIVIPRPKATETNKKKKAYLEKRLGRRFTVDEILSNKIVLSIKDVFIKNDLCVPKKTSGKMMNLLESSYIGFMSMYNTHIIFRNIYDDGNLRYYKLPVIRQEDEELEHDDSTQSFYVIPNIVDLLSGREINIRLCEGPFDILGLYYNTDEKSGNDFFGCVGQTSYSAIIEMLILKGMIGSRVNIHLYIDKTEDIKRYRFMINKFKPFVGNIYVYYNDMEKDYGYPRDRIDIVRILK